MITRHTSFRYDILCISVHICVYVCVCICICVPVFVSVYLYVYLCACVSDGALQAERKCEAWQEMSERLFGCCLSQMPWLLSPQCKAWLLYVHAIKNERHKLNIRVCLSELFRVF